MKAAQKTILVIDDDKDLVKSTRAFLEARNYVVIEAFNGTEARGKLASKRPDLIVLDIMMDYDAEGFNLAYELHTAEPTRRIPIVIVSGFEQHLDEKYKSFEFIQGREWPAAKYLAKPVALDELADSIGNLLRESEASQGSFAQAE